jgi:hypothetical protein
MLEFPVSSGNAHRSKEGSLATPADDPLGDWKPVDPEPKMSVKEKKEMEKFHEQMEKEEQALQKLGTTGANTSDMVQSVDLALEKEKTPQGFAMKPWDKLPEETPADFVKKMKPWSLGEADKDITTPKSDMFKTPIPELSEARKLELESLRPGMRSSNYRAEYLMPTDMLGQLAKELPNDIAATQLGMNPLSLARQLALPTPAATAQAGKPEETKHLSDKPNKVFENYKGVVVDIGTIVSTRLAAMRKLQVNPADAEALQDMYEAQKMMASWATSKNKPGQFVGSTGATVLSKHELNLGLQCWAKPDQFNRAEKVRGGFGEFMLKKLGWTDGQGLGKNKSGEVNPLQLDIKFDKKGLMAAEEDGVKSSRRGAVATMTACKDLAGKHPVSALTELCSKRRCVESVWSSQRSARLTAGGWQERAAARDTARALSPEDSRARPIYPEEIRTVPVELEPWEDGEIRESRVKSRESRSKVPRSGEIRSRESPERSQPADHPTERWAVDFLARQTPARPAAPSRKGRQGTDSPERARRQMQERQEGEDRKERARQGRAQEPGWRELGKEMRGREGRRKEGTSRKPVQKSDQILDDLFSSIREGRSREEEEVEEGKGSTREGRPREAREKARRRRSREREGEEVWSRFLRVRVRQ